MSRVIWVYDLGSASISEHDMPAGAEFRHVGVDAAGKLCAWMNVDNEFEDTVTVTFGFFTEDEPIPDGWMYRGSVHVGSFVLHVHEFSIRKKTEEVTE